MSHVLALYTILATCYLGWAVGRLLTWKKSISLAEQFFLSISLGTLLYTLSLLILHSTFGIAITLKTVFILLTAEFILSIVALFLFKLPLLPSFTPTSKALQSRSSLEKIVIAILAILIISTFVQNLFWPVTDWDALALYDFRARVVAETGSFAKGVELGYFFQYPPFTSLLHTTIYVTGAAYVKVWYTLIYAALISGIYAILRKRTSTNIALLGALMIAVNPLLFEHSVMAYTNLSYTMFLAMGTIYLWEWFRTNQWYCGIVGGLLIAGATWVRITEPFWVIGVMLAIVVSLLLAIMQKKWQPLAIGLISVGSIFFIKQIWFIFTGIMYSQYLPQVTEVAVTQSTSRASAPSFSFITLAFSSLWGLTNYFKVFSQEPPDVLLSRAEAVTSYLQAHVLPILAMYLIPLIFTGIMVLRRRSYRWLEWGTVLAYLGMIAIGTYVFSFSDGSWDQIGGSAQRMSMFLIPLVILLILEHPLWINKKK